MRTHPRMGSKGAPRIVLLLALAACAPDRVAPSNYGVPPDAAAETTNPDAGSVTTPEPEGKSPSTIGCDLSGRWLVVTREVSTGSGAQTASHEWFYFEIQQSGTALTVMKGLSCGNELVGVSAVSVNGDNASVWPAMQAKCLQTGRRGTSQPVASQCSVAFDRFYEVIGATVPHYLEPNHPLPAPSEAAVSGNPGWEDWDNDDKPGFTMNMSGLATGKLYLASRRWNEWSGTIPAGSDNFTIASEWNSEISLLGYDGSPLLREAASGTRANDQSLHFSTFVRLGPSEAIGDDPAICNAVRSLAPKLAPRANN